MGAGLGDDRTFGVGLFACVGGGGVRRGYGRESQLARLGPVFWAVMVHSSPAQLNPEPPRAFHFCGVSANSLDWSYSGRFWPRTDFSLAAGSAKGFSVALGNRLDGGFRCASRHQYLRRSSSLDDAEIRSIYRALISEHHQVPTVAAVPPHDARPRN